MASVINRTTFEYIQNVHTPNYPTGTWLINPDLSGVSGVPQKHWKVSGDTVVEMTQGEKDLVDAAIEEERIDRIMQTIQDPLVVFEKRDDFVGPNPWNRWAQDKVGATSTVVAVPADHGQIMIRAGSTNDDYATLTSGEYNFRKAQNVKLKTRFRLDHTNNMQAYLGFWRDWSNKVEFRADSGDWYTTCSSGGSHTVTKSAVSLDTSFHSFEIELSEVRAVFKIDGEIVQTHTTNLPSDLMYFRAQMYKSGSVGVRDAYCDVVAITGQRVE